MKTAIFLLVLIVASALASANEDRNGGGKGKGGKGGKGKGYAKLRRGIRCDQCLEASDDDTFRAHWSKGFTGVTDPDFLGNVWSIAVEQYGEGAPAFVHNNVDGFRIRGERRYMRTSGGLRRTRNDGCFHFFYPGVPVKAPGGAFILELEIVGTMDREGLELTMCRCSTVNLWGDNDFCRTFKRELKRRIRRFKRQYITSEPATDETTSLETEEEN